MSNPDPNLPPRLGREGRRHIGPLVGMALAVMFGIAMMFWWLSESAEQSLGPGAEPDMTQEEMMAPPASPTEGGLENPAPGEAGGETDAVGDPTPEEGPLGAAGDRPVPDPLPEPVE